MNKSAFLKLIKQVSDISDQQQSELEQVAATFPYCQTAHLLLAKSAYDKGSMLSTQRLRRASAYATDRQLLKRLIYASPVLEPVYEDDQEIADDKVNADPQEIAPATSIEAVELDEAKTIQEQNIPGSTEKDNAESGITALSAAASEEALEVTISEQEPQETETLDEVYNHTSAENSIYAEEEYPVTDDSENPEAEIDSELALLFTFSSISSSSTDLLSHREAETTSEEQQEALSLDNTHLSEATEALHDLEDEQENLPTQALPNEESVESFDSFTSSSIQAVPTAEATATDKVEHTGLVDNTAEAPEQAELAAEDAEINYSFDEIDRLYADDALGYWMGSSRMGEVLQLKDEYTRPRPQSFHPELILEYSKTHELEKAIQPTTHVLSKQLDIIDQFLKLNPRLKTMASLKLKPEPQEDLSLKSSKIKKGMASESLANIFIKQGKPKKAVKIYEQLILKYPEKKSYFAEQIEKLQNIT